MQPQVECNECKRLSRRHFLRGGLGALGGLAVGDALFGLGRVAQTYAQSTGGTGNLLVLCELAGGFDCLSFLAPYTNPTYRGNRPNLALQTSQLNVLPDHGDYGINKQFQFFSDIYAQNQLAIVQQVGYPRANGSHFESQDIWKYGVRNLSSNTGTSASWYERLRRSYFDQPFGVMDTATTGDPRTYGYPDSTYRKAAQDAFGRLARMKADRGGAQASVLDTYRRIDQIGADIRNRTQSFVSTGAARGEFFRAAMLASANLGTQILKIRYGGFDTHGSQNQANAQLFPQVNNEFKQFVDDLKAAGLWDRTCVCFYSEFGRRNYENGSPGTDHGEGGHIILAGPRVRAGLHGQAVTTSDLQQDSLPYYVDFRAVFGSCIRDWLGFDPHPIFQIEGETYDENVGGGLFA